MTELSPRESEFIERLLKQSKCPRCKSEVIFGSTIDFMKKITQIDPNAMIFCVNDQCDFGSQIKLTFKVNRNPGAMIKSRFRLYFSR